MIQLVLPALWITASAFAQQQPAPGQPSAAQPAGSSTAPGAPLAWSEAKGLIDQAVAAVGKPAEQRVLFEKAIADASAKGADQARDEALQAALEIAKAQEKKPITDATRLRALYTGAFSLDPGTRRQAVASAGGAVPSAGMAGGPQERQGGQSGQNGPPGAIPVNGAGSPLAGYTPLTAEHLSALRKYSAQHLTLRTETDLRGGGTTYVGGVTVGGYRAGPFGGVGWGWSVPGVVVTEPPETVRGWGVYQGPQRLTVPELLRAAGETQRAEDLEASIHKADTAAHIWTGVAAVGLAGLITGSVGLATTDNADQALLWNRVALAGTGLTITGLLGGSLPASKAGRLTHQVPASLTLPETQALVEKQNEALRGELGLSPEEVWQMESGAAP